YAPSAARPRPTSGVLYLAIRTVYQNGSHGKVREPPPPPPPPPPALPARPAPGGGGPDARPDSPGGARAARRAARRGLQYRCRRPPGPRHPGHRVPAVRISTEAARGPVRRPDRKSVV